MDRRAGRGSLRDRYTHRLSVAVIPAIHVQVDLGDDEGTGACTAFAHCRVIDPYIVSAMIPEQRLARTATAVRG